MLFIHNLSTLLKRYIYYLNFSSNHLFRPPSPKGALSKFLRSTVEDVIKRQKEESLKASYDIHPYKVTYLKDAYHILDKYPAIKLPYSTNLLNDYCQMLHPEINNRDVIIFAMH